MAITGIRDSTAVMAARFLLVALTAFPARGENDSEVAVLPAISRHRIRVAGTSGEETDIRDCLSTAVEAANAENLDGFCDCFTVASRSRIRRQAAIRFVQHDVAMELVDTQVIKAGTTTGEVAVKYRLVLSTDRFDVVSLVGVKRERGYWRIHSESIQSYEHQSPGMCSPSRYACLGGTCRLAARQ